MTKEVKNKEPVAEYLHLQGRYGHLTPEQIEEVQKNVDHEIEELRSRTGVV